jgi:hypothetical protein
MIAMQMADKDVIDALETDVIPPELDLRSFPAIDHKKPLSYV